MKNFIIFLLFSLSSCADYRYQKLDNPFSQYGIKSISVPMFYNQSNFQNISPAFTKEIYKMLSGFKGLKIQGGNNNTDATLVGIIDSQDFRRDSREATGPRSVKNIANSKIGAARGDFYIPSSNTLRAELRIIVIKKPTQEDIDFLKSNLGKENFISSKIIFRESIALSSSFTREILLGEATAVNSTQNRGAEKRTIGEMAKSSASTFRDMILYAF